MTDKDLINLPRYHAMVRLLSDGMPTRRFTLETFPPPKSTSGVTAEAIRSLSRERYATKSTEEIVALIAKKYRSQSAPRTSWV
ncbi:MAG: hypothetical protein IH899_22110 [Planctomycetes bacterium]|nr:hypothetical protein [Planctomycetota bacterium]